MKRANVTLYSTLCERVKNGEIVHAKLAGTVSHMTERKSAKGNRYAFLGLSDQSSPYEVALFSDILDAARNIIEVGQSVIISVEASLEAEQVRLRVGQVKRLEDLEAYEDINLKIFLTSDIAVEPIKNMLTKSGAGKIKILVEDCDKKKCLEVDLANRYAITPALQKTMLEVAGIQKIEEF